MSKYTLNCVKEDKLCRLFWRSINFFWICNANVSRKSWYLLCLLLITLIDATYNFSTIQTLLVAIYNALHTIGPGFYYASFWYVCIIHISGLMWFVIYHSGLGRWHLNYHMIALIPAKKNPKDFGKIGSYISTTKIHSARRAHISGDVL